MKEKNILQLAKESGDERILIKILEQVGRKNAVDFLNEKGFSSHFGKSYKHYRKIIENFYNSQQHSST